MESNQPIQDSSNYDANRAVRIKTASMILFWFGIIFLSLVLLGRSIEYYRHGTFGHIPAQEIFSSWPLIPIFLHDTFGHVIHIVAGYWLSKGRRKGLILGIALSLYEIISFLIPKVNPVVFTPDGLAIRILFAFVIFLIILGRKELVNLRSENWRPWKNPRKEKSLTERPRGVTFLGRYFLAAGILLSTFSIGIFLAYNFNMFPKIVWKNTFDSLNPLHQYVNLGEYVILYYGLISVVFFLIFFGISVRKSWGRKLIIVTVIIDVIISGIGMPDTKNIIESMFVGVDLLILYYMWRPNVMAYFGQRQTSPTAPPFA